MQTAMEFIELCRGITEPCCSEDTARRRKLTPKEQATYEACLETLRAFIVGEIDLGEPSVSARVAEQPHVLPETP